MNSKQLQYAVVLSETRNFSHAAEKLNISQPALSKQIMALEQELGVALFDRSSNPLCLTSAGECFVEEAREILFKEDRVKRTMESFRDGERGRLVIGVSPFRCSYMIPPIVKKLREKFGGIQVILKEADSDSLHKGAVEGQYDFAIMNLPVEESLLDVTLLEPEVLVLAVPNSMRGLISQQGDKVALSDCEKLPFVVLTKQQELRKLFDNLCAAENFRPEIAAEVVGVITAWSMARAGVGAAILPLRLIRESSLDGDVSFYLLKHNAPTRQPAAVRRKGLRLSPYAEYAIELLKN